MSLTSIKHQQEFEVGELAAFKARIEKIIGTALTWEVDLADFARTNFDSDFFDNEAHVAQFHKYCFDRIEAVFTKFCADADIKKTIAENLKTIKISLAGEAEAMGGSCVVEGGVLTMMADVQGDIGPMEEGIEMMITEAVNNMA